MHPAVKFLYIIGGTILGYTLLNSIGLGWLAALAICVAVLVFAFRKIARLSDHQVEAQRRGSSEAVRGALRRRDEAHREADCGLTHEERVRFQNIVENLDGDGTDTP